MVNILCNSIFDLHKNTDLKLFFGNVDLIFIKSSDDLAINFLERREKNPDFCKLVDKLFWKLFDRG